MTEFIAGLQQYGPMAVFCGILLWMNWQNQKQITEVLRETAGRLAMVSEKSVVAHVEVKEAVVRLSKKIDDLPCVETAGRKK